MSTSTHPKAALPAALVLVVGMGIGRFAFTGLYPQMVQEGVMSVSTGSFAASANNAGYLVGAVLAGLFPMVSSRDKCIAALIATVAFILALALPLAPALIIILRGLAGVASAVAMVSASYWLLHDQGDANGAPLLYSGVGIGTALSAELIAGGRWIGLSSGLNWLCVAAIASLLVIWAVMLLLRSHRPLSGHVGQHSTNGPASAPISINRLTVIYALAGFGGSITATYLPFFVRGALGSFNPVHVWTLFGLAAIPSSFLWHGLHIRLGTRAALTINLVVQGVGVGLPGVWPSVATYAASALLVGGAFMGTVTIVLPAARRVAHALRFNVMALMSTSYGSGLIVGPLLAEAVFSRHHEFTISLYFAAGALLMAGVIAFVPPSKSTLPVVG